MSNRDKFKRISEVTIAIINKGFYKNTKGEKVEISTETQKSISNAEFYTPEIGQGIVNHYKPATSVETNIEITTESTLEAGKRLVESGNVNAIALNFASAKHPGGGFLNGSSAQEESLARSSALFPTLDKFPEMYDYHFRNLSGLYSDRMIYSPKVPVFRNDKGELLDNPYLLSFISSPAVNKGAVRENQRHIQQDVIDTKMRIRIEKIIAISLYHGYDSIVLGAFGCGVFKNNPRDVARYFADVLTHPKYKNRFKNVVFAVYDSTPNKFVLNPFEAELRKNGLIK